MILIILCFRCNQKASCSVLISTSTFPEVCSNITKYLEAQYECVTEDDNDEEVRARRVPSLGDNISDVWSDSNRLLDSDDIENVLETVMKNRYIPITERILPPSSSETSETTVLPVSTTTTPYSVHALNISHSYHTSENDPYRKEEKLIFRRNPKKSELFAENLPPENISLDEEMPLNWNSNEIIIIFTCFSGLLLVSGVLIFVKVGLI